jgi:hypothetical protein
VGRHAVRCRGPADQPLPAARPLAHLRVVTTPRGESRRERLEPNRASATIGSKTASILEAKPYQFSRQNPFNSDFDSIERKQNQ